MPWCHIWSFSVPGRWLLKVHACVFPTCSAVSLGLPTEDSLCQDGIPSLPRQCDFHMFTGCWLHQHSFLFLHSMTAPYRPASRLAVFLSSRSEWHEPALWEGHSSPHFPQLSGQLNVRWPLLVKPFHFPQLFFDSQFIFLLHRVSLTSEFSLYGLL